MGEYTEIDICASDVPLLNPDPCPSQLIAPEPEDLTLTLTMGDYQYEGFLHTDIPDRIVRIGRLILELWRRLNFISAQFSTVLTYKFKYPRAVEQTVKKPDKTVTASAFEFVREMLAEMDYKLDTLTLDIREIRPVASIIEHYQIRPEANRPIGVFLFGEWTSGQPLIDSPKWQISVPHFVPSEADNFDNSFGYTKGSHQYLYTLNDNSKIIFYGNNTAEMDTVLERWLSTVSGDKLSGGFLKAGPIKGLPFSVRKLRLQRIDYYAQGILRSTPTMYKKFPRRPIEMPEDEPE